MRRSFVNVALTLLEGIILIWVGSLAAWLALAYGGYSFRSISDALYTASLATLILLLWCPRAWFPDWWLRSLCIRLTLLSAFSMLLMCADFFAHHYDDPWSSGWVHGPFVFMFLVIKWGGTPNSNPVSRMCRLALPFLPYMLGQFLKLVQFLKSW